MFEWFDSPEYDWPTVDLNESFANYSTALKIEGNFFLNQPVMRFGLIYNLFRNNKIPIVFKYTLIESRSG